jgi:hypothetical protein
VKTPPFDEKHSAEITAACREIEGRATRRLFYWQWGAKGLAELETALQHLPKKYRAGATAVLESGERLPNSYGHAADATYVTVCWRGGRWVLEKISRDYAKSTSYGKSTGRHIVSISITASQAEEMARAHRAAHRIQIRPPDPIELADTVDPRAEWKAARKELAAH